MYCTSCGAYIKDEYRFCTRCGAPRPPEPPTQKGSRWVPMAITGALALAGIIVYIFSLCGWGIN